VYARVRLEMETRNETILVVDDEEGIRRFLAQKLSGEGYRCAEAANGDEALAALLKDPVSLVILDVRMPGRSGVEILSEIKSTSPETQVIMATAVGEISTVVECMRLGAYDYLSKPFSSTDVVLSVRRALATRTMELELRDYHENLAQKVEEQARKIRDSFLSSVTALAFALEAKDRYTIGHSQRVSELAVTVGRKLGLPADTIEKTRIAGLVHDIGKIGIPEAILNKPGHLTVDEYEQVKTHCATAERILGPIIEDTDTLSMVRHHHERYDGRGYPDGLRGEEIPIGARILAVADTYDAMTSERPYRRAMAPEIACLEIEQSSWTQFDLSVATAFVKILRTSPPPDGPRTEVRELPREGGLQTGGFPR
jgi:putative two-component system response regulator